MSRYLPISALVGTALFLTYVLYNFYFYDTSEKWINFNEPKPADFTSLAEEEEILERFKFVQYEGIPGLSPELFDKKSIFQTIDQ